MGCPNIGDPNIVPYGESRKVGTFVEEDLRGIADVPTLGCLTDPRVPAYRARIGHVPTFSFLRPGVRQ